MELTRKIVEIELEDCLNKSGEHPKDLYNLGEYVCWNHGYDTICLDGDFTLFHLQCICWYMENTP